MVGNNDRHKALSKIADLKYQAVKLDMAKLRDKERGLRQNLHDLTEKKQTMLVTPQDGTSFAVVAGVDMRWQRWVDQRRALINLELAQVIAEQEELRIRLRQAFGKRQVAQAISAQTIQQIQQTKMRRAAYES